MWATTCKNLPLRPSVITHKKLTPRLHHYHVRILPEHARACRLSLQRPQAQVNAKSGEERMAVHAHCDVRYMGSVPTVGSRRHIQIFIHGKERRRSQGWNKLGARDTTQ